MLKFTKMHGLGNDYVYMDAINQKIENREELARKVSDRHFGIGSDGLILVLKSEVADFRMQMFNSDGTEAEMCGNGIRCVGKFVYDKGLTDKKEITLETKAGIKKLKFTVTELKKRAYEIGLDGGEEEREEEGELLQEEPEVVPMIPQFLQEDEVLAGAARGTAYHRVMELLDMKGMPEFTEDTAGEKENWKKYFMDWLDDQVRRGRIEEDAARCICWEDILQFAKSGIGRRLREADGKQRLWREQPFVLGIDARELYPEEEDGELILVQGIIDAYFMEEEEIVLVDYKTDRVKRGRTCRAGL